MDEGASTYWLQVITILSVAGLPYEEHLDWIGKRVSTLSDKGIDPLTASFVLQGEMRRYDWSKGKFEYLN